MSINLAGFSIMLKFASSTNTVTIVIIIIIINRIIILIKYSIKLEEINV
jgi:hypothetical protein